MSMFLRVLAWICIGLGAWYSMGALVRLVVGRVAGKQRHRRVLTLREVWSDLRSGYVGIAVGLSELALLSRANTPTWWLAQLPLYAFVVLQLTWWIRSRFRPAARGSNSVDGA